MQHNDNRRSLRRLCVNQGVWTRGFVLGIAVFLTLSPLVARGQGNYFAPQANPSSPVSNELAQNLSEMDDPTIIDLGTKTANAADNGPGTATLSDGIPPAGQNGANLSTTDFPAFPAVPPISTSAGNGAIFNGAVPDATIPDATIPNSAIPNGAIPNGAIPNGAGAFSTTDEALTSGIPSAHEQKDTVRQGGTAVGASAQTSDPASLQHSSQTTVSSERKSAPSNPLPLGAPSDNNLATPGTPSSTGFSSLKILTSLIVLGGLFAILIGISKLSAANRRRNAIIGELRVLGHGVLLGKTVYYVEAGKKILLVVPHSSGLETLTEITEPSEVNRIAHLFSSNQANSSKSGKAASHGSNDKSGKTGNAGTADKGGQASEGSANGKRGEK